MLCSFLQTFADKQGEITPPEVVAFLNRAGYRVSAEAITPRGGVNGATFQTAGGHVIFYSDLTGFLAQVGHLLLGHQPVALGAAHGHYGYSQPDRQAAQHFASRLVSLP